MEKGTKIIYLRRKVIAAGAFALAAALMFWVVNHPAVVGASATTRQLPIYCVQKDYKVLSISFDAAWGDIILRTLGLNGLRRQRPHFCFDGS